MRYALHVAWIALAGCAASGGASQSGNRLVSSRVAKGPMLDGKADDDAWKAAQEGGWWTLEFERKLDTGNGDDTRFVPGRAYKMAVSAHDRAGDMDKASGAIEIVLGGE